MRKRNSRRSSRPKKRNQGEGIVFARTTGGIYLPDCLPQVRLVASRGHTDDEIADMFGVGKDLFQKWKRVYPDFADAINRGRLEPDIAVIESLFKRAVGYDYKEEGLTKTGSIKELRRHLPGDVGAIKYWLNNRQGDLWKDRNLTEVGGSTAANAKPISVRSEGRDEMISAILSLVKPKSDTPPEVTKK